MADRQKFFLNGVMNWPTFTSISFFLCPVFNFARIDFPHGDWSGNCWLHQTLWLARNLGWAIQQNPSHVQHGCRCKAILEFDTGGIQLLWHHSTRRLETHLQEWNSAAILLSHWHNSPRSTQKYDMHTRIRRQSWMQEHFVQLLGWVCSHFGWRWTQYCCDSAFGCLSGMLLIKSV